MTTQYKTSNAMMTYQVVHYDQGDQRPQYVCDECHQLTSKNIDCQFYQLMPY